jgi:predicted ATPase
MLTRLRIKGFKNLLDVDLHFGPFTCIAGRNGVGKSNLFDAVTFLSDLASMPIMKAALKVRGTNGRIADIGNLFTKNQAGEVQAIEFVAEMIVSSTVVDDFDRDAKPTATFLEYTLELRLNSNVGEAGTKEPIYLEREELRAKSSSDAARALPFNPGAAWIQQNVIGPGKRTAPFIENKKRSSETDPPVIVLRGELQRGEKDKRTGRPPEIPARRSPQTVLSGVNTISHATVLAARREMQSWRLLQLEPSALRKWDDLRSDPHVSSTGEHLPATLKRLANNAEVATRLSSLIPGVLSVDVDQDDVRETLTVVVTMKDKVPFSASSLSDGTLRFLALAVLASDPDASGLVCMEEPENGIHPLRIPEMLDLVRSLADAEASEPTESPCGSSIRQVIINTHSPQVVAELPADELLMAQALRTRGSEFVEFKPMWGTWRAKSAQLQSNEIITPGDLSSYLQRTSPSKRPTTQPRVGDMVEQAQRAFHFSRP